MVSHIELLSPQKAQQFKENVYNIDFIFVFYRHMK